MLLLTKLIGECCAVQLGSRTILRAITAYKIQERTQLIGVANVGTNGIYGECGLRRQWGDLLTTQFMVHHGLMGSLFQIRVIRAGNTIVVPVHVSDSYQDVQSLLVALLAPPLLNLAISRCGPACFFVLQIPVFRCSRRMDTCIRDRYDSKHCCTCDGTQDACCLQACSAANVVALQELE